jgi:hypothetical protein
MSVRPRADLASIVAPAKTGAQGRQAQSLGALDPRFRGGDGSQ